MNTPDTQRAPAHKELQEAKEAAAVELARTVARSATSWKSYLYWLDCSLAYRLAQ